MEFVDIHSHVLHGLDDGAKTLDESVQMLCLAAAAGTTGIVATPHASSQYAFRADLIEQRIAELQPLAEYGFTAAVISICRRTTSRTDTLCARVDTRRTL